MGRCIWEGIGVIFVVCAVTWQGLLAFRHKRDDQWVATYQQASQAFGGGNYSEAERVLLTVLRSAEKWYPRDRRLADALGMLGKSYRADHNYQEAEPILRRALELYESIPLGDKSEIGRIRLNLGNIYRDQNRYQEAEQYYLEALPILEKNPLPTGFDRGGALLNLGYIRVLQGRYSEAEDFLKRSISAYGSAYGAFVQQDLSNAISQLANVYDFEGRYPEAKEQYVKALAIQEKIPGPNSVDMSGILTGLADVYTKLGQTSKAKEELKRAREIGHQSGPGDHPNGLVLDELGRAAERAGKYAEAEGLYKQSIDVFETTAGPEARDLAMSLADLGRLYRDEEQFDIHKAEPLLDRALSIREKALGREHPETAGMLSDLSLLYFYEHRYKEAEDFAARALPIEEKTYGPESLEVSTTVFDPHRPLPVFSLTLTDFRNPRASKRQQ